LPRERSTRPANTLPSRRPGDRERPDPQHSRESFKTYYGPTIAAYRNIADDPAREDALDRALVEPARDAGADTGTMQWEYLLVTARRAG